MINVEPNRKSHRIKSFARVALRFRRDKKLRRHPLKMLKETKM